MRRSVATFAIAAILSPGIAAAGEIVIGLGASDYSADISEDAAVVELEFHADPFASRWGFDFALGGAFAYHDNSSVWVGLGLAIERPLENDWFIEASFMPGFYDTSDVQNELGSDFEFRSLIGIGRRVSDNAAVSLALSHTSNAGVGDFNPGMEALTLRYHRSLGSK